MLLLKIISLNICIKSKAIVLVIFCLKCSLRKDFDLLLIFRNVCPFWTNHVTNFLKNVYILLLMIQFNNALSNFVNLASEETGIGYQNPCTTWFRRMGKEIDVHKIGPIIMPKRKGYKISKIFLICMSKRLNAQNWYS